MTIHLGVKGLWCRLAWCGSLPSPGIGAGQTQVGLPLPERRSRLGLGPALVPETPQRAPRLLAVRVA